MTDASLEAISAREAFVHYLRTGRRTVIEAHVPAKAPVEAKFNPYHDPRNGQFTFAPGGPRSLSKVIVSHRRTSKTPAIQIPHGTTASTPERSAIQSENADSSGASSRAGRIQLAQVGRPPSRGIGSNSGAFQDPMTLQQAFPGLRNAPSGSIIAVADNFLNLVGPRNELTASLTQDYSRYLINQIKEIDPNYEFASLNTPTTREGQINQINDLLLHRARAAYRTRGDVEPLQIETLRFLQRATDENYVLGVRKYERGELNVRLSREEAIGNFVDREVRNGLRRLYNGLGISTAQGQQVRVNSREYDRSGTDLTYRRPDARVGRLAFDVTLTRKTGSTPQVRGFFNADFKPRTVIIVRPSQLGLHSTYAILPPRN